MSIARDDADNFEAAGVNIATAEGAVSCGEMEFRRLLESLPAAAYICDADGLITYFNPQAAAMWGREPKLNNPIDRYCGSLKLFTCDGESVPHEECWMAKALEGERGFNGHEIILERPDGRRLTVLAYANPIRDDAGKLRGAVNVLVDITERNRMEDAMRAADRSKDEFLATLAHELRNPLAPMRNAVQVMRTQLGAPSPDAKWAMDVVERQMQHMTRLLDDLLDVSRITRNKLELRRERIELTNVLAAAVEISRPLIDASGNEFTLRLPPTSTPRLYLDGDLTRLAQAVSNLLNNAAKYTERGGRISLTAERLGDREILITVRDTGIGIPAEMLSRVFDMFTQVDRTFSRSHGGLGIGLTLVKRLVEMHGGAVTARSEGAGRGSEFSIQLPLLIEPAQIANLISVNGIGMNAMPAAAVTAGPMSDPPPNTLRVIVVDDSRDSANTLAMLLRLRGNSVRTAYDGAEALDLAREFPPDVMLLDIGMPGMNGYDAARAIRKQPREKSPVLIALTGWGQDEDRQRSKAAGFDHHIVKPVDPKMLLQLLASVQGVEPGSPASSPVS